MGVTLFGNIDNKRIGSIATSARVAVPVDASVVSVCPITNPIGIISTKAVAQALCMLHPTRQAVCLFVQFVYVVKAVLLQEDKGGGCGFQIEYF